MSSVCTILLYYSENLNWAAQNHRLGRMRAAGRGLDITVIDQLLIWYAVDPQL